MTTPITILLIDDNPEDRQVYRRFLEQSSSDYVVHEAEDRGSGLEAAARLAPDCILLDLRLGGESGYEVLFSLKDHDRLRRIPVIMLTGAAWDALEAGARSLGASGYLVKGKIDAPGLDRAIRSALLAAMTPVMTQRSKSTRCIQQ
jgi:CheY-like chemotaxis protein